MEPTGFGVLLKQYRMSARLTQEALAERANLSVRAISDLERGVNRAPRYDTLDMLTSALTLTQEQRALLFAAARPALPTGNERESLARPLQLLPSPPTPLIGREDELAYGLELLGERNPLGAVRLLTVTGPGGVGKTRLALQIAHQLTEQFADGLAYVDLSSIRDPVLVPQAVAQTLGLREHPASAFPEQVRAFLQDKQFLLVLDNFEQVLEAAQFVADLLAMCSRLQVLVTSRAPLRLRAEHQLPLGPLIPKDAAALFRERAQRFGVQLPHDRTPDGTLHTIAAICEQVDRLPLAIELAAVHVRVLSLPLLLERLQNRLRLLGTAARDLPERQRTMREAIAWSYNLLNAEEQRAFRAMGVFVGGCTLLAAEAVASGEEPGASDEMLYRIAALVDASLVQVETSADGPPRYFMLEVIREFAVEQLRASSEGEEEQYLRRHAEYYARLAEEAERVEPGQGFRETQLERESANGRAAWYWAYERGEVAVGLRLALWFGQFWFSHDQTREAATLLDKMLEADAAAGEHAAPLDVRGKALYGASRVAMSLGRIDSAEILAKEALTLAQRTGEQADLSKALAMLGSISQISGNEERAAAYFTESYYAAERGGEASATSLALVNLGEIARKRGEFERATNYLERSLSIMRDTDMTWGIASNLTLLGHLARQQGDYERAKARYQEGLALFRRLGNATYTAWCLEGIAAVAAAERRYERAICLCAAAAALRAAVQTPLPPAEQEDFDRIVLTVHAELDEAAFTEEWRVGSTMTREEAITYALMGLT